MDLMPTMQECSPENYFGVRRDRGGLLPLLGATCGVGGRLLKTSGRSQGCKPFSGFQLNWRLEMRVWLGKGARPLALGLSPFGSCLLCCFGLSGAEDGLTCRGSMSTESLPAASGQDAAMQLKDFASEKLN